MSTTATASDQLETPERATGEEAAGEEASAGRPNFRHRSRAPASGRPAQTTAQRAASKRERRRWIALGVLCLGQLMMVLDATIVNVALPSIQRELHFTQANLTWVIDGYLITFGGFLLLAGRFGDLVGRKKVFLSGLVLFVAASIACGLADSQALLIGARLIQGIGGAIASSVILAIIVTEFPERVEQAKAMGMYAFVSAGGGSIGLLAGGALTQSLSWHWIFFVNVPIGVVALVLGSILIEENEGIGLAGGVDVLGSILITLSTMFGAFAIVKSSDYGLLSARTLGAGGDLAGAAGCLPGAGGARGQPDHAAADPAPAHADGLEPRPRPADHGHVLGVLPRRAVPRARARLRRDRHGTGVHATDDRDRGHVDGESRRAQSGASAPFRRSPPGCSASSSASCCWPSRVFTQATSPVCSSPSSRSASARAPRSCRC